MFGKPNQVKAQACTGTFSCCLLVTEICSPAGCIKGSPGCTCSPGCAPGATQSYSCQGNTGENCDIFIPAECQGFFSGSCNPVTPPPGSTPTPPPGVCYQCHPGASWCESYVPSGGCTTDCSACPSSPPPGSDPCPNDSCSGTCCNYACGQGCIVTADCKSSGQPVYCLPNSYPGPGGPIGKCVNPLCPNDTIPGTLCACSGGLTCGQPCAGGCTNRSICTFTDPTCTGSSQTYCVGISAPDPVNQNANYSTFNPSYIGALCSPGAWHLVYTPNGQSSGFTLQQILATCPSIPWWQTKDGDIVANGTISSAIPSTCTGACVPSLSLNGGGGYPGTAIYGGSLSLLTGNVSSKKWNANTTYLGKTYDYRYFEGLVPSGGLINEIPSETIDGNYFQVNGTPSQGFVWFRRTGNLTITGNVNVTSARKVILLVKGGNLTVSSQIRLMRMGDGFFMAIVGKDIAGNGGNIYFNPALVGNAGQPAVEGLFLADAKIYTGAGNQQLYVRGTLAGLGGLVFKEIWGQIIEQYQEN